MRLIFIILLLVQTGFSATYWNAWTTNAPGTPVKGNGDLSILSGGVSWNFYGSSADTVARLADIGTGGSITNGGAGPGVDVVVIGNTLWITNLWSTNGFVGQDITNGLAAITFAESLTNGFVTATVTNGLATVAYVNTATNGFVAAAITNGLAGITYVSSATNALQLEISGLQAATNLYQLGSGVLTNLANNAGNTVTNAGAGNAGISVLLSAGTLWITNNWPTNGFVTASITNGLATVAYVNTATNGFVDSSITNGLATVAYVNTATNGFVGIGITNGLAAISYVNTATGNLASVVQPASANLTNWSGMATSGLSAYYLASNPSSFVTASITNGLAGITYVDTATGNLATVVQPASANLTNWSGMATSGLSSYYLASNPSAYVTAAITNGLAALSYVTSATGNLASVVQPASVNLTNWSGTATSALASYYLASNPSSYVTASITNGLLGIAAVGSIAYSNAAIYLQRTNDTVRGLIVGNATVSRAATFDANGVLTNDVGAMGTIAFSNAAIYLQRTNDTVRGLTVGNATASRAALYDANGVLTNAAPTVTELNLLSGQTSLAYQPTNNNTVTAVTATGTEIASISAGTLTVNGGTEYNGCSGNFSIAATTIWWPINNSKTNFNASDVSGGTRSVITRNGTLTNLYVVMAGTVGNNNSNHFQIFTNGVATTIAVLITGAAATTGNDTTHSAAVLAGMEVGVKIISSASATARAVSWALEKR